MRVETLSKHTVQLTSSFLLVVLSLNKHIICDIRQEGIIGQDFLLNYAESISYKDGRIKTKLNEIVCWLVDERMVTCRMIVRRTTTIPSLTATWLPVDIPGSDNLTKYGYIKQLLTLKPI